jgi:hypothetical protein
MGEDMTREALQNNSLGACELGYSPAWYTEKDFTLISCLTDYS